MLVDQCQNPECREAAAGNRQPDGSCQAQLNGQVNHELIESLIERDAMSHGTEPVAKAISSVRSE